MADLVTRTVEDEKALLEKQRLRTERKQLRKQERNAHLETLFARIKSDAATHVYLKRHMFKTDEELDALGLSAQQKKIVRQWQEPKKATAFGIESSAKLIEAETRAKAEKVSVRLNVENATIVLPEKREETIAPIYIDVEAQEK